MLAAKLAFAVSPTAARNHCGGALLRASGEYGKRGAKAAAYQSDAIGIHFWTRGEVRDGVARVGHLIEADNSALLAFAFAAAPEIDAQRDVAPLGKLLGDSRLPLAVFVAAEAVHSHKRRPALDWKAVLRSVHYA